MDESGRPWTDNMPSDLRVYQKRRLRARGRDTPRELLITQRSQVQILPPLPVFAQVRGDFGEIREPPLSFRPQLVRRCTRIHAKAGRLGVHTSVAVGDHTGMC